MASDLLVETPSGKVQGIALAGGKVRGFLGVPVGSAARWKRPVAVSKWEGVKDATNFGAPPPKLPDPITFIPIFKESHIPHSEDCLFANVYAPPAADIPKEGLPVMIWIYGGALTGGETSLPLYHGESFVAKAAELGQPVILVSVNYRINVFGFLASKELQEWNGDGSTGNLGFYDQKLGLEFVRDNVRAFGGDPARVTVFGESAGAVSTDILSIAFAEDKLFDRAILQSGNCLTMPAQPVSAAQRVFDLIYTHAGGPADLKGKARVEFLLTKSTEELLDALLKCRAEVGFAPVIDGVFLRSFPAAAPRGIRAVLCGTNLDEGTMFAKLFLAAGEAGARGMLAAAFPAHHAAIAARYEAQYGDFPRAFDEFFNDAIFQAPMHAYAGIAASQGIDVYRYRFEVPLASSQPIGLRVHHACEIPFVFHQAHMLAEDEVQHAERMVRDWTAFAHGRAPEEGWPRYNDKGEVLVYGPGGTRVEGEVFREDAMGFWAGVFAERMAAASA
ncbi:Alpha/Beta hydrolase protein [Hyaloraphidium curvatum]|nr:Alpha/Beta hydrolase protein [Hyaloraphidium curvatum]